MTFQDSYSLLSKNMKASKIRELMKYASMPGVISFSGGLPDPEHFPFRDINSIISSWDPGKARLAMQYGATTGYVPLVEILKKRMESRGIDMSDQDLIITTGGQQALFLLSRIFLDGNDTVLCEDPTFIGGVAAFLSCGANLEGIALEEDGLNMGILKEKLENHKKSGSIPKFLYTIPNFQNPAGVTLSLEKRAEVHALCREFNLIILEDDPYCDLYFEGTPADYKPVKSLADSNHVVYVGSFSKILCPGLRLGWVVAHKEIIEKIGLAKQSVDACSSTFGQVIAHDYLEKNIIDEYVEKMRGIYREKKEYMLSQLREHLPSSIKTTNPKGGFFIYLTLPENMSGQELFKKAIEKKVAFVTGEPFHTDPADGDKHIRLSFSNSSFDQIKEGIRILGEVIKAY